MRLSSVALALTALAWFGSHPSHALYTTSHRFAPEIRVCWLATSHPDAATLRQWTEAAANGSWARYADLSFDFGNCTIPEDSSVSLALIGFQTSGVSSTTFGGAFNQRATITLVSPAGSGDITRFTYDAIRQFGLALGFVRLLQSPALPCQGVVPSGAQALGTTNDPASVMNDCAGVRTTLSPWDIVGVQRKYFRKRAGTLLGPNNRVVALPTASGTQTLGVRRYQAAGFTTDWRLLVNNQQVRTEEVASTQLCFDAPGGFTAGSALRSAPCNLSPNQQFVLGGVQIRGIGDKCLEYAGSAVAGARVQIATCQTGKVSQKWTPYASELLIQATGTTLCLSAPALASGQDLVLAACDVYDPKQRLQRYDGTIRSEVTPSLCLNSEWGDPVDGRAVQLYGCTRAANELWYFRGDLRPATQPSLCADIRGGVAFDGAIIQAFGCHGGANQTWDYYFP